MLAGSPRPRDSPESFPVSPSPPPRRPRPYEDAPRLPASPSGVTRRPRSTRVLSCPASGSSSRWALAAEGFITERLEAEPRCAVIALEVRRKWATIVDARVAKRGLAARGRVFAEDAKEALTRLGPDGVFRCAFLHFPDPWWKKRHEKRLVMGDAFLTEIARLVAKGGDLFIQTDVEERAVQYEAQISGSSWFEPAGDASGPPRSARIAENPFGARSPRERRAITDGLPVYRMLYRRTSVTARG